MPEGHRPAAGDCRKRMFDVCEDQLLVLLLVLQAEHDALQGFLADARAFEKREHVVVHTGAIRLDLLDCRS